MITVIVALIIIFVLAMMFIGKQNAKIIVNLEKNIDSLKLTNNNLSEELNRIKFDVEQGKLYTSTAEKVHSLNLSLNNLQADCTSLAMEKQQLNSDLAKIKQEQKIRSEMVQNADASFAKQQELAKNAFEQYCENMLHSYEETQKEYEDTVQRLKESYAKLQDDLIKTYEQEKKEIAYDLAAEDVALKELKATRQAAMEAARRETQIKENLDSYCLKIPQPELNDIKRLESIKPQLNNPRILSMLIWQTYWQKPLTKLCNNLLGTSAVIGIYKITNQIDNSCYIGQSVDVGTRWKQHAKCGCGIDTPVGNKLYAAMQRDGIENFSWELLEVCSRDQLDDKEAFYIDLYDAKNYGYNSTKGNK